MAFLTCELILKWINMSFYKIILINDNVFIYFFQLIQVYFNAKMYFCAKNIDMIYVGLNVKSLGL